jgi:hypothetical protein
VVSGVVRLGHALDLESWLRDWCAARPLPPAP